MDKVKNLIQKLMKVFLTREMISYIIAGVLTTLINVVTYHVTCNILGIPNLLANTIAWVVAVLFAFFVNDLFVFISKKASFHDELIKFCKFVGARIASFVVEELGMYVLIDCLHFNNLVVKVFVNVVVIAINYVLSKWFIFNKK